MTGTASRAGVLLAATLLAALPQAGCAAAINHPAATVGVVGATLGFSTCKLAKDDYAACGLVGAGAGAFLALVAVTALWLGGDGQSAPIEEQAQPLPEDGRPIKRHHKPSPVDPDAPPVTSPVPLPPAPAAPASAPAPAAPAPAPAPAAPAPMPPTP